MDFVLAVLGTGLTLWQFVSPWPQLHKAAITNAMDKQDLVTLISMAVNSGMWSTYAIIMSDEGIFLQNGACLMVGVYFNFFYYQHSRAKHFVTTVWAVTFGILACCLAYCLFVVDWKVCLPRILSSPCFDSTISPLFTTPLSFALLHLFRNLSKHGDPSARCFSDHIFLVKGAR